MKAAEFKTWIEAIDRLSNGQMDKLREKLDEAENGMQGVELTHESPTKGLVCPRCGSSETYRWGTSCNLPRYMCRGCKRTFSALTNTPLSGLPNKARLLDYEQVMAQWKIKKSSARRGVAIQCGNSIICVHPQSPAKQEVSPKRKK